MAHPPSYNDYTLPQVKFSHHPASSPVPTAVILVIINRPEKNNAFTDTMMQSLVRAFNLLSSDPRVKCIVFTGGDPGNKFFCAGMDLDGASAKTAAERNKEPAAAEVERERDEYRDGGAQVSLAIHNCNKPVIAALNGHAVGVGITMTLPANLRIASSTAKIGFVFSRRGINMEACSSFFLPRILGHGRALTVMTTGATYPPTNLLIRDLFADVVPAEKVIPRALEIATEVASKTSSVSTRAMRDMIYRGPDTPEKAFLLESRVFFDLFRGADAREGIASFLEKREPRFDGQWEREKPAVWPWWDNDKNGEDEWLKSKM